MKSAHVKIPVSNYLFLASGPDDLAFVHKDQKTLLTLHLYTNLSATAKSVGFNQQQFLRRGKN
jgi:hypothetical protein